MKIVIVGDSKIGKSTFINQLKSNEVSNTFPHNNSNNSANLEHHHYYYYEPTVLNQEYQIRQHFTFVDTPGMEEMDRMRPPAYMGASLYLICYNDDNPQSLLNIQDRWIPEIQVFGDKSIKWMLLRLVFSSFSDETNLSGNQIDNYIDNNNNYNNSLTTNMIISSSGSYNHHEYHQRSNCYASELDRKEMWLTFCTEALMKSYSHFHSEITIHLFSRQSIESFLNLIQTITEPQLNLDQSSYMSLFKNPAYPDETYAERKYGNNGQQELHHSEDRGYFDTKQGLFKRIMESGSSESTLSSLSDWENAESKLYDVVNTSTYMLLERDSLAAAPPSSSIHATMVEGVDFSNNQDRNYIKIPENEMNHQENNGVYEVQQHNPAKNKKDDQDSLSIKTMNEDELQKSVPKPVSKDNTVIMVDQTTLSLSQYDDYSFEKEENLNFVSKNNCQTHVSEETSKPILDEYLEHETSVYVDALEHKEVKSSSLTQSYEESNMRVCHPVAISSISHSRPLPEIPSQNHASSQIELANHNHLYTKTNNDHEQVSSNFSQTSNISSPPTLLSTSMKATTFTTSTTLNTISTTTEVNKTTINETSIPYHGTMHQYEYKSARRTTTVSSEYVFNDPNELATCTCNIL